MDFTRTRGADWLAALGGLLLLVSLFLPWYSLLSIGVSGWEVMTVIDVVLAVAALLAIAVPFVIAARDAPAIGLAVSIVAATIAGIAIVLVLVRVIWTPELLGERITVSFSGRPGDLLDTSRSGGLWVGLVAALITLVGTWRSLADMRTPGLRPSPEPQHQPAPPAQAPAG